MARVPDEGIVDIEVQTRTHFSTMTEMQARFIPEDGKTPGRLLLCEFIDNSLFAMLQSAILARKGDVFPSLPPIELHIFYRFDRRTESYEPYHLAVLDEGPGMTTTALTGWAELARPASERNKDEAGCKLLDEDNAPGTETELLKRVPTFQADGRLGIFGKGSKSAGFYYGTQVRAITRPKGSDKTSELHLDRDVMHKRNAENADWQVSTIHERGQSEGARHKLRSSDELDCPPLLDLYARADSKPSYSLFVISKLHEQPSKELSLDDILTTVCELRDTYSVYCDAMADAFNRLVEKPSGNDTENPKLPKTSFKYGPLDVNLTYWTGPRVMHKTGGPRDWTPRTFSLRPDRENSLKIDEEVQRELAEKKISEAQAIESRKGLAAAYARSPLRAIDLAAPEVFCFRFQSLKLKEDDGLGLVEGFALYLPFVDGEEQRTKVQMHQSSRAFCFWKGRQMHYAVSQLPPFMQKDLPAGLKEVSARVVLILSLGSVKEVDDTKFRLSGDLNSAIEEKTANGLGLVHFEVYKNNEWRRTPRPPAAYKTWLEEMHHKYDRQVVLSVPLEGEAAPGMAAFAELNYSGKGGDAVYKKGDAVKLRVPTIAAAFRGGNSHRVIVGKLVHFAVPVPADQREIVGGTYPTCEVVYTRIPEELYGETRRKCAPSAFVSKHEDVVKEELQRERDRAPSKLTAAFVTSESADSAAARSARCAAASRAIGDAEDRPLVAKAREQLPSVRVSPINKSGQLVTEWMAESGELERVNWLQMLQAVRFKAEGMDAFEALSDLDEKVVQGVADATGILLNTSSLPLYQAGLYQLHYQLVIRDPEASSRLLARHYRARWPSASVWVKVEPGKIKRLSCKCLTNRAVLGEKLEIEVSFLDGDDDDSNRCFADKDELAAALTRQTESREPFVESADGLLTFPLEEIHLRKPKRSTRTALEPAGMRSGVLMIIGLNAENEVSGLRASERAMTKKTFSRNASYPCHLKLKLRGLSGGNDELVGEITHLPVFSGGAMTFDDSETPWLTQPDGVQYHNRTALPELVVCLTDPFGAPPGIAKKEVRIRTEPKCPGIDGAVAYLDTAGKATFNCLVPEMSASDLPTELTVYVDPPRGEDADSLQGSISLVHSNRPTRVVLYDEDGDLPRVGRSGGRSAARLDELEEGETREYELHAEAGSRVVGLGARVETEAGDTVSSAHLHVLLNGSALSADAKAKFKASGALPPFDVPKECEVGAEKKTFVFSQGDDEVAAELYVHAVAAAPAKWAFVSATGEPLSDDAMRRSGRSGADKALKLRNGQPLSDLLSVRLVDRFSNVVKTASAFEGDVAELYPVIRLDDVSPESEALIQLALNKKPVKDGDGFDLDIEFKSADGRGEYELTGRNRRGVERALSLSGKCSIVSVRVTDREARFEAATVRVQLLPGDPHALRLSDDDAEKYTRFGRTLRTREHFAILGFVVSDEAGNPVKVNKLSVARLTVREPTRAVVSYGDRVSMHKRRDGSQWELHDVSFSARRDAYPTPRSAATVPTSEAAASSVDADVVASDTPDAIDADADAMDAYADAASAALEHTLTLEKAVATVGDVDFPLNADPLSLRTQLTDTFVVDIKEEMEQPELKVKNPALVAGSRLLEFKMKALMEDGSVKDAAEFGSALNAFLCTPSKQEFMLKRDRNLYAVDEDTWEDGDHGELTKEGKYTIKATYEEKRPEVVELLREHLSELKVKKIICTFDVVPHTPTKLELSPACAKVLSRRSDVNNIDKLRVLGQVDLCLRDRFGNEAKASGKNRWLEGAVVAIVLEPAHGEDGGGGERARTRVRSGGDGGSGDTHPLVDGSKSVQSVEISASSSKITLGPLYLQKASGKGDAKLRLRFVLHLAPGVAASSEVSNGEISLPGPVRVNFIDMHGLNESERQKKAQEEEQRRQEAVRRDAEEAARKAAERRAASEAALVQRELQAVLKAERAGAGQMAQLCDDVAQTLDACVGACNSLLAWAFNYACFVPGGVPAGLREDQIAVYGLWHLLPWAASGGASPDGEVQIILAAHQKLQVLATATAQVVSSLRDGSPQPRLDAIRTIGQLAQALDEASGLFRRAVQSLTAASFVLGHTQMVGCRLPPDRGEMQVLAAYAHPEVIGPAAFLFEVRFVGVAHTHALTAILSDVAGLRNLQTHLTTTVRSMKVLRDAMNTSQVPAQAYWPIEKMGPGGKIQQLPQVLPGGKLIEFARNLVVPAGRNALRSHDFQKVVDTLFGNTVVVEDQASALALMEGTGSRRLRIVALDGFQVKSTGVVDDATRLRTRLEQMPVHLGVNSSLLPLSGVQSALSRLLGEIPGFKSKVGPWRANAQRLVDEGRTLQKAFDELGGAAAMENMSTEPRQTAPQRVTRVTATAAASSPMVDAQSQDVRSAESNASRKRTRPDAAQPSSSSRPRR